MSAEKKYASYLTILLTPDGKGRAKKAAELIKLLPEQADRIAEFIKENP